MYRERDEDSYEVDGDMKLTDFNNLSNFGIEDPRMTTIGGFAFRHLDRLPRVGDSINIEDICISVLEMDGHRIARVSVSRGNRGDEVADTGELAGPVAAEEAADEVPGDSTDSKGDDQNSTDISQSVKDSAHSGSAGPGDTDGDPDRKVVH